MSALEGISLDEIERRLRKIYEEMDANEKAWNAEMAGYAAHVRWEEEQRNRRSHDPRFLTFARPIRKPTEKACTRLHITEAEVLANQVLVPLAVKALLRKEFPFLAEKKPRDQRE